MSASMPSNMQAELQKLKVVDLQKALKERGLATSGLKAELVLRLQEALEREQEGGVAASPAIAVADSAPAPTPSAALNPAYTPQVVAPSVAAAFSRVPLSQTPAAIVQLAAVPVSVSSAPTRQIVEGSPAQTPDAGSGVNPTAVIITSDNDNAVKPSPSADDANYAVKIGSKTLTKEERAKRFGNDSACEVSDNSLENKMATRAQRFGLPSDASAAASDAVSVPKLKQRADRFGEVLATKLKAEQAVEVASSEQGTRLRRAERFGLPSGGDAHTGAAIETRKRGPDVAGVGAADSPSAEQLAKRASRFGTLALNGGNASADGADEERRRARSTRFGAAGHATPENGSK